MKQKDKLSLIDNYVSVYRLLYNCQGFTCLYTEDNLTPQLSHLTHQALELKHHYEIAFEQLGLIDETFLGLQQELNDCISNPTKLTTYSIQDLADNLNILQSNFNKLKSKFTLII